MSSLLTSLPKLLPVAFAWAEEQESRILKEGTPLSEAEIADARRAGVAHPEKIRVLRVEVLPEPDHEEALFVAKSIGFFGQRANGLTLGHGIYLCRNVWGNRHILVHECVHVSQYEKLGGIQPFLSLYLRECIDPGYPFGALEREAIYVSCDICKEKPASEA
jgi:hypothetical protein